MLKQLSVAIVVLTACTAAGGVFAGQGTSVDASIGRDQPLNFVLLEVMSKSASSGARACADYLNMSAFQTRDGSNFTILKTGALEGYADEEVAGIVKRQIICGLAAGKIATQLEKQIVKASVSGGAITSIARLMAIAEDIIANRFGDAAREVSQQWNNGPMFQGWIRYGAGGFGMPYKIIVRQETRGYEAQQGTISITPGSPGTPTQVSGAPGTVTQNSSVQVMTDERATFNSPRAHLSPVLTTAQATVAGGMMYAFDNGKITISRAGIPIYDSETLDGKKYKISHSAKDAIVISK